MLISKVGVNPRLLLRALIAVMVTCSMAGLLLTMVFSFEEPNGPLLLVSLGLLMAAVIAVFAHLAFTRALDTRQKRMWLRLLCGRRAGRAWAEYLGCDDLLAAADRLSDVPDRH